MTERPPTTTCFVGNVAYGVTEDQLRELFREVGPVKSFRLVTDRDTGKPKGYGFCEFYDLPTSQSAQRNLNGHEVGGRALRVDFADDSTKPGARSAANGSGRQFEGAGAKGPAPRPQVAGMGMDAAVAAGQHLTGIVGGAPPTPGGGSDQISATLATKSRGELYEVLAQMQALVKANAGQARAILLQNPQLTKALFQAQIMLGLVQLPPAANGAPHAAEQPLAGAPGAYMPQPQPVPGAHPQHTQPAPAPQPVPYPMLAPHPQPVYAPYAEQGHPGPLPAPAPLPAPVQLSAPMDPRAAPGDPRGAQGLQPGDPRGGPMHQPGAPMAAPAPGDPRLAGGDPRGAAQAAAQNPGMPYQGGQPYIEPGGGGLNQPPAQQPPYAGQPVGYGHQAPQAQAAPAQPAIDPNQQQALLQQVMQLTAEQVASLPPAQRAQVEALQQHMVRPLPESVREVTV